MTKTVLSAIQPTGEMHFGNYFGAIQNWVNLQSTYQTICGVVDYHAMTAPYNPKKLKEGSWNMIFDLLACGLEPNRLFIQSLVPEHAELAWILSCCTSYGQTTRMTQFKDKSEHLKSGDKETFISVGLFSYPILQAADILIYHPDYVPVGKDQEQHLELTRDVAQRFNQQFKTDYFKLPEGLFTKLPKVLSTADPSKKMSKSLGDKHFIRVFGEESETRKKIKSAVTDAGNTADGETSPGVLNLFALLHAAGQIETHDALQETLKAGNLRYSELKEACANALVELSSNFKEKRAEILANRKDYKNQIRESSNQIRQRAIQTMKDVREITGLATMRY